MKKISLLLFIFLFLGFGCKGLTAEEQASIRPVKLKYWTIYGNVSELRKMADAYQALRPFVTVEIKKVNPEEFDSLFVNALADDVSPDIVSINARNLKGYISRLSEMPASVKVPRLEVTGTYFKETKLVEDSFSMPDENNIKSAYINTVYEDVVRDKKIYGLPFSADTLALYYNKDLLDKAGIPEPPQTWQQFMDAVAATTRLDPDGKILQSGVALGTGNNIENSFDLLSLFMLQSGVVMSKGDYIGFSAGLDRPVEGNSTLRAMDFYTDFARSDKKVYSWNESMGSAFDEFVRGKTVFYFGFAYDYPRIKEFAPQMNMEIVPVPQLNSSLPVNVANYYVEAVSKKSKNKSIAWDFLRFVSSPESVKKYTTAAKLPSPLRAHITEQKKDVVLAPFVEQILNAKNWYRGSDFGTAKNAFNTMIHTYLQPITGESSDRDVLRQKASAIIYAANLIQQTI